VLTGHILKDTGILQRIHEESAAQFDGANPPVRVAATVAAIGEALDAMVRGT
jgi:hypothetical protein